VLHGGEGGPGLRQGGDVLGPGQRLILC
jgi:hypothetical protein